MKPKIKKKSLLLWLLLVVSIILMHLLLINKRNSNNKSCNISDKEKTSENTKEINNSNLCSRVNPYKLNPEFERGISLLYQRIEENIDDKAIIPEDLKPRINTLLQIRNCLNIQYYESNDSEELDKNLEGYFVVDTDLSIENLQIYVNNKYSKQDDAVIALLLVHELTHAAQFVDNKVNENSISCIDSEVEAIRMELRLLNFFKAEYSSIKNRIDTQFKSASNSKAATMFVETLMKYNGLGAAAEILNIEEKVLDLCKKGNKNYLVNINECIFEEETKYIREYVLDNPYYKEQCGIE